MDSLMKWLAAESYDESRRTVCESLRGESDVGESFIGESLVDDQIRGES